MTHELPKSLPVDSRLYVYPRPFRGMDFNGALRQLNGEVATKRHLQEDPFEYLGIREYTPRDTLRDVNWKATARSGELKVNQKGCTAQRSVRLVVNLEDGAILRQEDLLEASIEIPAPASTESDLSIFYRTGHQDLAGNQRTGSSDKRGGLPESILRRRPSGQHFPWTCPDRLGEAGTFL